MKRPLAILLLVIMVLPPTARAGQLAARAANAVGDTAAVEQLDLLVGRSAIVRMDRPITRVSLSTPDVADALVTTPYEVLIHGKAPGTISMMVWGDNGRIKTYDVAVRPRSELSSTLSSRSCFPARKSPPRATAKTWCCRVWSPASTSSIAPLHWRWATSKRRRTS